MGLGFSQHVACIFERIADCTPERVALVHGEQVRTWRAFDDRASRLARALSEGGVVAGETVAIAMYNAPEWLEAFYAALKIRAVPANVNYRYKDDELMHILRDSDAAAVVFHTSFADTMMRVRARLPNIKMWIAVENDAPEAVLLPGVSAFENLIETHDPAPRIARPPDECFLSYTGGTTGLPKGVMMTVGLVAQSSAMFTNMVFGKQFPPDTDPVMIAKELSREGLALVALPAPPLMHATGLSLTSLPTLAVGGTVVTLTSRSLDAHELLDAIDRHKVNRLTIVGDAFARPILRAFDEGRPDGNAYSGASLRVISSAGVAWTASVKEAMLERFPNAVALEACGAAEGVTYGTRVTRRGERPKTGNFDPAPGVLLVDDHRRPLPMTVGQTGQIASPAVASGYLNDPAKTAETYCTIDGTFYAVPGDFGRIEADGSLTLLGRRSGVINTGGEKVYPDEVEDIIKQMDGVDDCLVFGIPDERLGETVTALVQLTAGATLAPAAITAHTKAHLAGYKAPRAVIITATVPRGPNGKGEYRIARQHALDVLAAS